MPYLEFCISFLNSVPCTPLYWQSNYARDTDIVSIVVMHFVSGLISMLSLYFNGMDPIGFLSHLILTPSLVL